jgi:hypothetical protein
MKANFTAALVPWSGSFRRNRVGLLDGLFDRWSRCTVRSEWQAFEIGSGDGMRFFLARFRRLELGDRGLVGDDSALTLLAQFLGRRVIVTEVVSLDALIHCESACEASRRHAADLTRLSRSPSASSASSSAGSLGRRL